MRSANDGKMWMGRDGRVDRWWRKTPSEIWRETNKRSMDKDIVGKKIGGDGCLCLPYTIGPMRTAHEPRNSADAMDHLTTHTLARKPWSQSGYGTHKGEDRWRERGTIMIV